jgi:hypothetical protein
MPEVGGEFVVDGAHIWAEAARKGETLKVRIEGAATLLRLVIDTGHETLFFPDPRSHVLQTQYLKGGT